MKQALIAIALISLSFFLFCTCSKRVPKDARLDEIEKCVRTNPEKADSMLQQAWADFDKLDETNRRAFELMKIRVNDKNLRDTQNDSLLKILDAYYEGHGTKNDRMLVAYYWAAYYRDHHDFPQAEQYLQKALSLVDSTAADYNNDVYIATLAQLAALFIDSNSYREALRYAKKAYNTNDVINPYGTTELLAKTYSLNCMDDSAKFFYNKAFDIYKAQKEKSPILQYRFKAQMSFFVNRKDWPEVKRRLPYFKKEGSKQDDELINFFFAVYYWGIGQRDSAYYHFQASTSGNPEIVVSAYRNLYEMSLEDNNDNAALKYARKYIMLEDSIYDEQEDLNTLRLSKQYDYGLVKTEKENSVKAWKSMSLRNKTLTIAFVLFLLLVSFLGIKYRKKFNQQISLFKSRLSIMQKKLHKTELSRLELQNTLDKEKLGLGAMHSDLESKEKALHELQQKEQQLASQIANLEEEIKKRDQTISKLALEDEQVMTLLRNCIAKKRPLSNEESHLLRKFILGRFPRIQEIVQSKTYNAAFMSQLIFSLHLMDFSNKEIALLTNNSPQNVTNAIRHWLIYWKD